MNLKSILEYQKKDSELIKLERSLSSSENKKIFTQMVNVVKEAQNQSSALETQAGEIINAFNSLKKTYSDNTKTANILANKNMDTITEEEIISIEDIAKTITNNLSILEKKLLTQAEKVRNILSNFDSAKKRYNQARDKYNKHKELYDKEVEAISPEIAQKTEEVKKLESNLDSALLSKYKHKRQDRIYPVFVPCLDKSCGGCRMELPSASFANLKKDGLLECEHCRRIIYLQQ